MYLFLIQAYQDLGASASDCNDEIFQKFVLSPENWVPLPNFLEVNENRIREGDPNVALDLRIAIYKEMPFFREIFSVVEEETAPPVAAHDNSGFR